MEVSRTWREEKVTQFIPDDHFLKWIDMRMTIHSVMGNQHGLTTRVVSHSLADIFLFRINVNASLQMASFEVI
jgi:hypothetical protein